MLSNHWLRVRAFRSKVFFGQLLSWKPVQIIIHRSKRIRITWKETKERCLCWLVSHIGFPIISRKWVQSLRIYRSHLVAISQKPNQAWKCFDLEGTSCFLTVYKKSYKVSYLCIEIERRLLERLFNNVKAHILRPYFMQVNYLWLFLFLFLQRNSQGLHGSKHRKHRRGSRKHSKGSSKENSSAIEALVEQVNNSSSVILEAELQAQTDDGSSSR